MTAPALPLTAVADPDGSFAASMLALRQAKGWNVKRLAREAGVSPAVIYRLESGTGGCQLFSAWRIAEALEVTVDAMIRGESR